MLGWLIGLLEKDRRTSSRGGGGGGGGRARIRLGNTGPRGRIYATATTPRMRSCVVKSKFVRATGDSARHIAAHLKYSIRPVNPF